ncbi:UvrD/REP helicase N-terminal domain-containing protein [Clostridium grantii DSM 8605]|uniref:UvrD/REP helicase N-terminal domain-containing protein n=1 Tax=Clostridium grantii DSM 8605 TaxID=1121316 RepID=A0A1M5Y3C3_9CLOT|nr:UvrD-helicase domain-containing protein [Clostridium grantii]SHI06003.1 UvrD/REP helicase N-terminal domain-containing protein [Clostridium grantii DSM 8605]
MDLFIINCVKKIGYNNGDEFFVYDGELSSNIEEELKNTDFNVEQFKVEHSELDNHIIIKAGAGSGKTKVMIDRVMYLRHFDDDIKLSQIVMITFTNKAAIQIKEKLNARLEAYYKVTRDRRFLDLMDEMTLMKVDTIHS